MQQINKITSVLDANQVYGSSAKRNSLLRTHSGGEMLVQSSSHGDMLPVSGNYHHSVSPLLEEVTCKVQLRKLDMHGRGSYFK